MDQNKTCEGKEKLFALRCDVERERGDLTNWRVANWIFQICRGISIIYSSLSIPCAQYRVVHLHSFFQNLIPLLEIITTFVPSQVELAALLHDIGDYKYSKDPSEERLVENFLEEENIDEAMKTKILRIIKGMGFKEELQRHESVGIFPEFGVVQDADRLDAIGAIGIARCFTFGGRRNRVLHDPAILPRLELSKEQYMKNMEQTTVNHFHEKLLKLKDLMKTEGGKRRAEKRHKFMAEYLEEFYKEWNGEA
ncbi:hypothetical protein SAY87_025899 [Trapa incisa]|uniref:HD domain-containing protein n=1 Tax=Trapa incisa TaxID=236973 RepID=A0AAN7H1X7_9MYRT|nr:hypothetical protein SAY87_025899 [Trapa incisa]